MIDPGTHYIFAATIILQKQFLCFNDFTTSFAVDAADETDTFLLKVGDIDK